MPDVRFFHRAGPFPLREIAALVRAEPLASGDDAAPIHDIAPLESAGPDDISVFSDLRYIGALLPSRARSILISRDLARHADDRSRLMVVKNARLAYAQVGQLFYPRPALEAGIDARARVHPSASIGTGSRIDAGAIIGAGAEIGARCHISYNAVLGEGVRLGEDCRGRRISRGCHQRLAPADGRPRPTVQEAELRRDGPARRRSVDESAEELLGSLITLTPPRDRQAEAAKHRAPSARQFGES